MKITSLSPFPLKSVVTISLSNQRAVFTTLKMGTETLRVIDKQNPEITHFPIPDFFSLAKLYLQNNGDVDFSVSKDLFDTMQIFRDTDPRPIFFYVRDPQKALLSGVSTVFSSRISDFKEPAKIFPELYIELEKHSGTLGERMFEHFGDDLFEKFLRFSLKYFPQVYFNDPHINNDYYYELLSFLLFLKDNFPSLIKRLHIINLDEYSRDEATLKYLKILKLIVDIEHNYKIHSLAKYSHLVDKVIFHDKFFVNHTFLLILGNNIRLLKSIEEQFKDLFFTERVEQKTPVI